MPFFFFVFGLYMAFKGMISLTAVSFILDEWLLNRLLERMANQAGFGLRVWIYLVIGAVLSAVLYGWDSVFIGAGLMTSLIYVLMLQKLLPIAITPEGGVTDKNPDYWFLRQRKILHRTRMFAKAEHPSL
ncbi:hypothetical protein CM49_01450 [Paenibacillus sp. P1XP2]|nr:hypothetical protein CM49_01450 [Paenibacillus sp. P1XP2]